MIDTLQTVTGSGGGSVSPINWGVMKWNFIGWTLFGLFMTAFYFWLRIRSETNNLPNTWKEFFSIRKNQTTLVIHLVVYFTVILMWIYEGGVYIFEPIGNVLKRLPDIAGLHGIIDDVVDWFCRQMPRGRLTFTTALWGYGITEFIRKAPVVWVALKGMLKGKFPTIGK